MAKQKAQADRDLAVRVGSRIRQLRAIQHISQIRLATEVGIRAGPLGWIEKGLHLPSGRVLYRVAKQLNVRIDDLFQETNIWEPGAPGASDTVPVLLPPLDTAAGAEAVKSAHIICQSLAGTLLALEDLCGTVKTCSIPLLQSFSPTESGAEYLAQRVRQNLGIGSLVMSDYVQLFENMGLRVVFMEMPEGCETFCGYDCFNRNAFIFVNNQLKKQPELQMFRMLFELGRVFWFASKSGGAEVAFAPPADEEALGEAQFARRFATFFLMPTYAVTATLCQLGLGPKGWTLDMLLRLKKHFGVSALSFAQRLQSLKLTWSDKQKRSPRYYLFKDEIEAFHAANGPTSEPGGPRAPLEANGHLYELVLQAEEKAGKDQKPVNAIKRALRQSGVKLDTSTARAE